MSITSQILTTIADGYDSVREGAGDCVRERIAEQESKMTVRDLALIRRSLMNTFDAFGEDELSAAMLFSKNEDELITSRMAFADAVTNYIVDRLAPALKRKDA